MGNEEATFEEDYKEDYNSYDTDEDIEETSSSVSGNGVGIDDKPAMQQIWSPEENIIELEMNWKGFSKKGSVWVPNGKNALARDEFINATVNSIRSVINSTNMISKMREEDIEYLLLEKNLEFSYAMLDEFSVDEDDYETMANQFDHVLETFFGIVNGGHGSSILTQVYAGLHEASPEKNENKTFLEKLSDELNGKNKK